MIFGHVWPLQHLYMCRHGKEEAGLKINKQAKLECVEGNHMLSCNIFWEAIIQADVLWYRVSVFRAFTQ